MKLKNVSNYPLTVKGVRIETGETEEVEVEDVEYYVDDRRFEVEEDDEESDSEEEEEEPEGGSEDESEISKPEKQNTDNKGD